MLAKLKVKKFSGLEETRKFYLNKLDELAEIARNEYVTPGSGQAITYQIKYEEALAGSGLMIEEEAASLDMNVSEVAASILEARNTWLKAGAKIEGLRLKGKSQIRKAASANEMHSIIQGLNFSGNQET